MRVAKQARYLVEGYLYAAAWPAAQSLRRRHYPPPHPTEIAFTFDDGPNAEWTPQLLDILAAHEIKAAFFLVGRYAEAEPALVRRMALEGHTIGNHSWSHPNLAKIPAMEMQLELERTSALLEQITGEAVRIFRPPFGSWSPEVLRAARGLGMLPVFWNAMTDDWVGRSPERIVDDLVHQIERNRRRRRSTCLVLHDGRADNPYADCGHSVEAASHLIGELGGEYRFVDLRPW